MKKGILILLAMNNIVHAGNAVWSFRPNGSPVVNMLATSTATISYTVINHSSKAHQLLLSSQTPAGITQVGGACILSGVSATNPRPTCTLTLNINASALPSDNISGGPILCQANNNGTPNPNVCYQPSPQDTLVINRISTPGTTLSASVNNLALSVNKPTTNVALTGNPRVITITNTGLNPATDLSISYPNWPSGTTATSTCGSVLGTNESCSITITPGADATSHCTSGIAPTPGAVTVSASNAVSPVSIGVVVLSYGCQYQGGFLYSVNDTVPNTESIGGKVVTLVDQAEPYLSLGAQTTSIIWSSNGQGKGSDDGTYDIIPLIAASGTNDSYADALSLFNTTYSNTSTFPFPPDSAFLSCNGESEGGCNSANILALSDTYKTGYNVGAYPYTLSSGPTNRQYYAAGLCTDTNNSYSDWYLPVICDLDSVNGPVICPEGTQSMFANLSFLLGDPNSESPSTSCSPPLGSNCLAGRYWSSTEGARNPRNCVWSEGFSNVNSYSLADFKGERFGVRCSRNLIS